jgi:endonuclease YncB( thermonuclease family)
MGWVDTHPWQVTRRRRRARRLEAALVGATAAVVFLILEPHGVQALRLQAADRLSEAVEGPVITSRARVVDGDGLRLEGYEIRLDGIDAFELHQACDGRPCGSAARAALSELISGQTVTCRPTDTDPYGRTIATCRVGGRDLGAELVRAGHALAYRRYSTAYVDEEAQARRAGAGAWSGMFENPEDWRRSHPRGWL